MDPKFHDLVTDRRLSVVSTSDLVSSLSCFFLFFLFTYAMQQPRFATQHSVIVRGTSCPTTNLTITMTILKFNLDYMGQATMMAPYVNRVSSTTSEWNEDSRWHVLPPHGLNPWEDAALPPHELNRWEDTQHKHLSHHHMHSNMGRTLNLPLHELNHRKVHLSRIRVATLPNHSSATTQVECL